MLAVVAASPLDQSANGICPTPAVRRRFKRRTAWAKTDFLDGAIGIALALLSAVTDVEPASDRLLLRSGRAGNC